MNNQSTSSELSGLSRRMRESVDLAKEAVADDELLVVCIHPEVDAFIREEMGIRDGHIAGVSGVNRIMVTDGVPGFCVLICNENL